MNDNFNELSMDIEFFNLKDTYVKKEKKSGDGAQIMMLGNCYLKNINVPLRMYILTHYLPCIVRVTYRASIIHINISRINCSPLTLY
jgi:hypothetical protein